MVSPSKRAVSPARSTGKKHGYSFPSNPPLNYRPNLILGIAGSNDSQSLTPSGPPSTRRIRTTTTTTTAAMLSPIQETATDANNKGFSKSSTVRESTEITAGRGFQRSGTTRQSLLPTSNRLTNSEKTSTKAKSLWR
jgi:hypothetical protein